VGFINTKEAYEVTIPYGLVLPPVVERSNATAFNTLKKYAHCIRKALRKDLVRARLDEDTAGSKANPIAALNIIIDFIENGIYREFEYEYKRSTHGKINFKKTLRRMTPSIVGDDICFTEFIASRKKVHEQNTVALAQANIINHFMANGGEVLFGNRISLHANRIRLDEHLIHRLNKIKATSFNSRKQQLIRWMVEYIQGAILEKELKGEWLYSIVAYTLWEEMIDACFSNQKVRDRTKYGKRPTMFINGKVIEVGSLTRHDTLYEAEDEIVIFDAKMYESKVGVRTGQVFSKQHGYYDRAYTENPEKMISNVLILPYCGNDETDDVPGFQPELYSYNNYGDENDIILVYEISFDVVLDAYYRSRKLIKSFKEELHQLLSSEEHKEARRMYHIQRSVNMP